MKMTANESVHDNYEDSPPRKRLRCDTSLSEPDENDWKLEKWSLLANKVLLDSSADVGIGQLESDSEEQSTVLETYDSELSNTEQEKVQVKQCNSITLKECNELLVYKPKSDCISKINHFQHLCDEIILHIFRNLSKNNLATAALVCHRWYQLAQDESLWSRMDLSSRYLESGAIGHVLSRQVLILSLSSTEICHPPILPNVPAALPDFKSRLLFLDLSMTSVSTSSLIVLFSKCYRLKKLSLENVEVNDSVMKELSHNRELEVLNLAMVEGLTKMGLIHLLSNCWTLKELNLSWTGLNIQSIQYLCSHLPSSIDRLNISGCRQHIRDEDIWQLVSSCPNLRELDLSDCTGLTGRTVQSLVELNNLNFLALSRCYFIPYRSLLILKAMKSLTYLDVYGGHIESFELSEVQDVLGSNVNLNKFKFSSVARPTVGKNRGSIWGLSVRDL